MRILPVRCIYPVLVLLVGARGTMMREQVPNGDQSISVIEVSAEKYDFKPDQIHVKRGTKVQLKVHSVDEAHGIKLSLYPIGSRDKSSPGLLFTDAAENGKVEKDKDQVLEFVAQRPGTYEFKCARFCGLGHGRMKGKLVVDQ